ncbi:MAG: nodulation protein NfeD [Candidatus Zixiibacteriota bacterium]|nr:MAG: nodulation protein NfeD [candidate division Zixibacteria bacterium]
MKRYPIFWIFLGILLIHAPAVASTVLWIEVDGVIHPASARFISDALEEAEESGAEALLIELDTPGGLMESMRIIAKDLLGAEVPVIVYVAPSGARAGSAGVFVTLAAHVAAMAPGTNIGAAHPVTMGAQPDSVMAGKMVNDAAAFARSLAERRGRNADWAEKAVRESASITETEALTLNVVDLVAPSRDSLLAMVDGRVVELPLGPDTLQTRAAELEEIPMSWRDQLLDLISNPNIAYVLMLLGIYGLFFELYNPGAIVPGVIGGICLILAFFAFQTLPVNIAGLLLILLSVILFLLEIKVTSYGILSIGGTIALVLGSVMLIDSPIPGLRISWSVIIPAALGTLLFFALAIGLAARAQRRKPTTGYEGMIGEIGRAIEDLAPTGQVKIHGEIWYAKAMAGTIPAGQPVRVTGVKQLVLQVEPYTE